MKKIIVGIMILGFCFLARAFASTVSTTDGQNFLVTNDAGISANYTNAGIVSQITQANSTIQSDYAQKAAKQQDILRDTETLTIWESVQQMEVNAYNSGTTNAACSTNTTCWSGVCTNSVCQ